MSLVESAGRASTTSPAGQNTPHRGRLHSVPVSHVDAEMSPDRQPPHDADLERAVLEVALLHGDYATDSEPSVLDQIVATGLQADHFYDPAHGRVWGAVLSLLHAGEPVDVHTVAARCRDKSDVASLLQGSAGTVRTPAPTWARLVIEYARCRRLLPLVESAMGELLAGRLREVRLILEDITSELTP